MVSLLNQIGFHCAGHHDNDPRQWLDTAVFRQLRTKARQAHQWPADRRSLIFQWQRFVLATATSVCESQPLGIVVRPFVSVLLQKEGQARQWRLLASIVYAQLWPALFTGDGK